MSAGAHTLLACRGDRRTKKLRQMRVTRQIYIRGQQRFIMRLHECWYISIFILLFTRTLCLNCIMCLMCPSYWNPTKSRQPRSCLWWHVYLHRQDNVSSIEYVQYIIDSKCKKEMGQQNIIIDSKCKKTMGQHMHLTYFSKRTMVAGTPVRAPSIFSLVTSTS
jgi:hypothetical protein